MTGSMGFVLMLGGVGGGVVGVCFLRGRVDFHKLGVDTAEGYGLKDGTSQPEKSKLLNRPTRPSNDAMEVKLLRIVVASPSDVEAERDEIKRVAAELNRGVAADRGLRLEVVLWKTDAHPGFHPEGPQGLIDPVLGIEESDILIGIFWKRFGTPTKGALSGTEHEIRKAYEAWQKNGRPQILVYFNQEPYTPTSKAETEQSGQVLTFKSEFLKRGLWWDYAGSKAFGNLVRNHLIQYIRTQYELPGKLPDRTKKAPAIFIAYRRKDSADVTGRINDWLVQRFGAEAVFVDVESIPLGVDFQEFLGQAVGKCNVLLAVIGEDWKNGLDDSRDFVRIEIESALQRNIPIIPLLVRGGTMPMKDELPPSLQALVYRQGMRIRPDPDFRNDMKRLIKALGTYSK